jgi:cyclophilin family peptidyl-prolyl cis-trans isomerase
MKKQYTLLSVFLIAVVSLGLLSFKKKRQPKEVQIKITTVYGDMVVKLYNETPQHRDNFIKLVEEGFYDSLLFHRVINNFMIQGGDPDSKLAAPNVELGNGGPGYDIPAEFVPTIFHQKGALAAAREGDDINPTKMSSGSQFYIVQGMVWDSVKLREMEFKKMQKARSNELKNQLNLEANAALKDKYMLAIQNGNKVAAAEVMNELEPAVDSVLQKYVYSQAQIDAYSSVGGTPHLDADYTVFGQVVEGLDIIDSIAQVRTDRHDRPLENVLMYMEVVK